MPTLLARRFSGSRLSAGRGTALMSARFSNGVAMLIEQKDAPQPEQREAAPLPSGLIELELAGARARIPVTAGREVILAVIDGLSMRRR